MSRQPDPTLETMNAEERFARRIEQHGGPRILVGLMDADQAREAIRTGILERGLQEAVLGRNRDTGKPETYRQAFTRLYGAAL